MTVFFFISCAGPSQKNNVEVIGGFDGANPQSQEDIIQETQNTFRIKPFNEEGSSEGYYFRFTTKVMNYSSESQDIELIIEWPALKKHPNEQYK